MDRKNEAPLLAATERLLSQLPVSIVVHAGDSSVVYANPAALTFLGLTEAQISGRSARDPHWHFLRGDGTDMPVEEHPVQRVLSSRERLHQHMVGVVVHKDAAPRWAYVDAFPEVNERGGIERVVVSFVDVSQLKVAHADLRQTQKLAGLGGWSYDAHTRTATWSEEVCRLMGIESDRNAMALSEWRRHLTEESVGTLLAAAAKALSDGARYEIELEFVGDDKVRRWGLSRGEPVRNAAGAISGLRGTIIDVTERKRSQLELEKALERLQEAQRIGKMGDFEYEVETASTTWSPALYTMWGRDPALGPTTIDTLDELFDEESREVIKTRHKEALLTGEPQYYETAVRSVKGRLRHYEVTTVPVQAGGRVQRLVGTVHDITERKQTEAELMRRVRQQEQIALLGRLALAETDLDLVFSEAVAVVAEGLDIVHAKLLELAHDGTYVVKAATGWAAKWIGERLTGPNARLSEVVSNQRTVIVEDFRTSKYDWSPMLAEADIRSAIDIPIFSGSGVAGILGAYSGEIARFSWDEMTFLQTVANILGTAIERKRNELDLALLAQYDVLTGLPNRVVLRDRLEVATAEAKRSGKQGALLFIDLDRFKNVNDSLGHGVGDKLIKEVAQRLAACVRSSDTVSRHGGDEFLVLLSGIENEKAAARVAEEILRSLGSPLKIADLELLVTASIGIACYPENGQEAEILLRNADAAMYSAKEAGRNTYQFYSDDMNRRAQMRLHTEAALRQAVHHRQFVLQFQPQVGLDSTEVIGLEALVRWMSPERGVVPPNEFIPIAEESGLILQIGEWVMEEACRQAVQWRKEGLLSVPVAVNVSAPQFRQPRFVQIVEEVLKKTDLAPPLLELELTESIVMDGADAVREKLVELAKLGVKLAIDDFGTGYSSLSYLKQFPINRLKIDKSFVFGLPDDHSNQAICSAIVSMGHSLGVKVLAEGVETVEQAHCLASMGCDFAQGFFYSHPLDPANCSAYLRRGAAVNDLDAKRTERQRVRR